MYDRTHSQLTTLGFKMFYLFGRIKLCQSVTASVVVSVTSLPGCVVAHLQVGKGLSDRGYIRGHTRFTRCAKLHLFNTAGASRCIHMVKCAMN